MNIHVCRPALMILLFAALPAVAKDMPPLPALEKENADAFKPTIDRIQHEMDKGGRYEYIKDDDRNEVNADLDLMLGMIREHGTVAAMKDEDRVKLFNTQEKINAILTNSDSNRLICEKVPQPGTMLRQTSCHTVAEARKRERESQDALERSQNHLQMRSFQAAGSGH